MQTEEINYKLNFDGFGQKRKYKLNKKRRQKIIDTSSWLEADTINQWYYKDYNSFYIVISMYKEGEYSVTCSGHKLDKIFISLDQAKAESFKYCDR